MRVPIPIRTTSLPYHLLPVYKDQEKTLTLIIPDCRIPNTKHYATNISPIKEFIFPKEWDCCVQCKSKMESPDSISFFYEHLNGFLCVECDEEIERSLLNEFNLEHSRSKSRHGILEFSDRRKLDLIHKDIPCAYCLKTSGVYFRALGPYQERGLADLICSDCHSEHVKVRSNSR